MDAAAVRPDGRAAKNLSTAAQHGEASCRIILITAMATSLPLLASSALKEA
jgi:hypothetical protein